MLPENDSDGYHLGFVHLALFKDRAERAVPALGELAVQAKPEMHWWVGRTTYELRRAGGELRMRRKTVVLMNAAEPLPNLAFLL